MLFWMVAAAALLFGGITSAAMFVGVWGRRPHSGLAAQADAVR
jgi:hypothetical protein